ncbi:hypothetical protein [Leifsonia shinshuensis]|nr:hypothetical protein [Leifsonia shinshuensis]
MSSTGHISRVARIVGDDQAQLAINALTSAGYLEPAGDDDADMWVTTIAGNALAQASFGKPISRKTADRLVAELVERAKKFNADPTYVVSVARLRVFGSYQREDVDPLGDVDVELIIAFRPNEEERTGAVKRYSKASGRRFNSYLDELFWPETELRQILKNRSAAINITQENVDLLTDRVRTIYAIEEDKSALPANGGRRAFG